MDALTAQLASLTELVEGARAMPLSSSCVVNRVELLERIGDLTRALPVSLAQAKGVLDDQSEVVQTAQAEAARIVEQAMRDRDILVSQTAVLQEAEAAAGRLLDEARSNAEAMRLEAEDYVDGKLATFEVVLGKTLAAVERGRSKLAGHNELDVLRDVEDDPDTTPLPG